MSKPFIYAHELISNGGGVWLGCDSEETTRLAHIDGKTGDEVIALYKASDYDALQSLNAELLEALETYAAVYAEHWKPGMPILEPISDATIAKARSAQ